MDGFSEEHFNVSKTVADGMWTVPKDRVSGEPSPHPQGSSVPGFGHPKLPRVFEGPHPGESP